MLTLCTHSLCSFIDIQLHCNDYYLLVFAPTDNATTNGQSHHGSFDALSMTQSSRHKNANASTYDMFGNTSHSADPFGTNPQTHSQRRHSHADLSVLSYGTSAATNNVGAGNNANGANANQATNSSNARNGIRYNGASSTQQNKHNEHLLGRYYNGSTQPHKSNAFNSLTTFNNGSQQATRSYTNGTTMNGTNSSFNMISPATGTFHTASTFKESAKSSKAQRIINSKKMARSKSYQTSKASKFHGSYKGGKHKGPHNRLYDGNSTCHLRKGAKTSEVTGVHRLSLHHDPPVVGCGMLWVATIYDMISFNGFIQ